MEVISIRRELSQNILNIRIFIGKHLSIMKIKESYLRNIIQESIISNLKKMDEGKLSHTMDRYDFWDLVKKENDNFRDQPIAYVMVGMPGSGKSTWIKNNIPHIPVVSRDIIRAELGYTSSPDEKAVLSRKQEDEVTQRENELIAQYAQAGESFAIDDINTGRYRQSLVGKLRSYGVHVKFVRLNTDLETCIKRREGQIPADVMRRIHAGIIEPRDGEYDSIEMVNEWREEDYPQSLDDEPYFMQDIVVQIEGDDYPEHMSPDDFYNWKKYVAKPQGIKFKVLSNGREV